MPNKPDPKAMADACRYAIQELGGIPEADAPDSHLNTLAKLADCLTLAEFWVYHNGDRDLVLPLDHWNEQGQHDIAT